MLLSSGLTHYPVEWTHSLDERVRPRVHCLLADELVVTRPPQVSLEDTATFLRDNSPRTTLNEAAQPQRPAVEVTPPQLPMAITSTGICTPGRENRRVS